MTMNKGKWIILLGAPGCGKGTQAEYLINSTFEFEVISVGNILRESKSTLVPGRNKTIGELIGAGMLLPDEVVVELVCRELLKINSVATRNLIFDGYPRTIGQAETLNVVTNEFGNSISYVLNFEINNEILLKRIFGRYKCLKCGKIYNDYFLPTKVFGVCDSCGGVDFDRRTDDNKDSLSVRLAEYHEKTYPLIDFYAKSGILYNINAEVGFEEVRNCILNILNKENK